MPRALELTARARWWPSAIYQTTTLELRRDDARLLVDPGIARWEIAEVAAADPAPVAHVLITHADWDHVLGIPELPDAEVVASARAAAAMASGETAADVHDHAARLYVDHGDLRRLRVDRPVEAPAEGAIGAWPAAFHAAPGHTDDGLVTWLPDERLLVAGDHLSALELPMANHSPWRLRDTLGTLSDLIARERPEWTVVGHGRPHGADEALALAEEDIAYLDALCLFADAGGTPDEPDTIRRPRRGIEDDDVHRANVDAACRLAAAGQGGAGGIASNADT